MSLKFSSGVFRVSCCKRGHVTLEVLDGKAVKFVAVMSRREAADLSMRLALCLPGGVRVADGKAVH